MESLLMKLQEIEDEHKEFFEKNKLKLSSYVNISKTPLMIRYNEEMDNKHSLPYPIYEKVHQLILSYYAVVRL